MKCFFFVYLSLTSDVEKTFGKIHISITHVFGVKETSRFVDVIV